MTLPHDEAGAGPALLLLHAGIADRTMWAEHLEPLAGAGFRVLAPDMPGFGEAPVSETAPWLDVLAAMDDLGVERAAVVGTSFGGAIGLRMAVVAPERVSALAMVSAPPPVFEPSPRLAAAWEAEEAALEREDVEAAVQAVVDAWTLPSAPPELRERVATMQRRAFALQAGAPEPPEAPDPVEDDPDVLTRLDLPTLVAVGEHDMPDFLDGAEAMARAIPGARHEVLAGAGHLAPLETPDAFRDLVLDFLAHGR